LYRSRKDCETGSLSRPSFSERLTTSTRFLPFDSVIHNRKASDEIEAKLGYLDQNILLLQLLHCVPRDDQILAAVQYFTRPRARTISSYLRMAPI
jgi:hypothetical protein